MATLVGCMSMQSQEAMWGQVAVRRVARGALRIRPVQVCREKPTCYPTGITSNVG